MERLAITGKVWGVIKYYNPTVGKGIIDWDSVLIITLKKIKNVANDQAFYEIIDELIIPTESGNMDNINTDSLKIFLSNNDIDWIENREKLPDSIRYKLELLIDNKYSYKNYYVDYDANTGNVTFYNEKSYPHQIFPTVEYRLLGLFRYWNAINYFYPYKYIIGREWDEILYEYMPLFIQATDTLSYHLTVLSLTSELNDSHAITYRKTLQEYWGYFDLPFITRTIEGKTVILDFYSDSLADLYGLKRGDIITKMNDSSIQVMKNHLMKHIVGSNNTAKEKNINYFLWGGVKRSGYCMPGNHKRCSKT